MKIEYSSKGFSSIYNVGMKRIFFIAMNLEKTAEGVSHKYFQISIQNLCSYDIIPILR